MSLCWDSEVCGCVCHCVGIVESEVGVPLCWDSGG